MFYLPLHRVGDPQGSSQHLGQSDGNLSNAYGLTRVHIHVFAVADYTDSGQAFDTYFANFPRLQLELCVISSLAIS